MKILLVGDTHGSKTDMNKIFAYACRVDADRIIQLGDFGFGFHLKTFRGGPTHPDTGYVIPQCDFSHHVAGLVAETGIPLDFEDGNHDNHAMLQRLPIGEDGYREIFPGVRHIPRGTLIEHDGVRFLVCGGAISVDRNQRKWWTEYWPDEAITPDDVERCEAAGAADVVLTHDAPLESRVLDQHTDQRWPQDAVNESYRNRQYVQRIWDQSGAKFLFHGHIHHSYSEHIDRGRLVVGLDKCDGLTVDGMVYLLDTNILRSKAAVDAYWAGKVR